MKKILTFLTAFLPLIFTNAQTIFEQDFENGIAPMTLVNNDGKTPATNVAAYTEAWNVVNPTFGNGTNVAVSVSWYTPAAAADDWMITPAISLPAGNAGYILQWDAKAQDASFPDGYQIKISTTGTALADFTTNALTVQAEMPDWNTRSISLAAYAGQTIHIAFRNNSNDMFLLLMDNIFVGAIADNDVAVSGLTTPRFVVKGTQIEVTGDVTNKGSLPLSSFDLTWSDGTTDHTETITLPSALAYGQTTSFTHPVKINVADAVSYNFTVNVNNPNGLADGDMANNEISSVVSGVSYIPSKKMLSEEATGTWCGWCPRGTEWMDFMAENYPDDFVGVAVHNDDPMVVAEYDAGLNGFPGFSGYPSVIIDRSGLWDPSDMENILQDYLDRIAPVAPSISDATIDVATRKLTVTAGAEFVTQLAGIDYRLNVVLIEDGVTGTGAGYNQTNYYSDDAAGSPAEPIADYGYNFDELPDPVPAADIVYNHVGRAILGGYVGTANSIPASVVAGDIATKEYTVNNFNTEWNPFNMHAVVMVIDNATGEVLNTESEAINVVCPASFGAVATATPASNFVNGAIALAPPSATYGFGGYTYLWSNGETTPNIDGLSPGTYTLVITDRIGCSQSINVGVTSTSNVEDIASLTSFSLTPNPASSVSVLTASFGKMVDARVEMVNVEGKVVAAARFDKTASVNHSFDLSNIANGMYLVKMTVGNQVHTERLVITK